METLLQQIVNGLVVGSVYALVALGYTMVYGILGLINFAHGEVVMVGALTALLLGAVAVAQQDLKQLLAASTSAQLGFVVMGAGLASVSGGAAHLAAAGTRRDGAVLRTAAALGRRLGARHPGSRCRRGPGSRRRADAGTGHGRRLHGARPARPDG